MRFQGIRIMGLVGLFLGGLFSCQRILCHAQAEHTLPGFLYESPYVSFHEYRGEYFWTIRETLPYTQPYYQYIRSGNPPEFWYRQGTTYTTGQTGSVPKPERGQHYYECEREGIVPIGKWAVCWEQGRCIHGNTKTEYGGRKHTEGVCYNAYYSGWLALCADCGKPITTALIYASQKAVRSISHMDTRGRYYYDCPTCGHLENSDYAKPHLCTDVSWNQYQVVYDNNTSNYPKCHISGYMEPSLHMYNDEHYYDGELVNPVTALSHNNYVNVGYTFVGWNTKPDGSGVRYEDGATIRNLSHYDWQADGEKGIVTLYAQWRQIESTLVIDPGEGTYEGKSSPAYVKQFYDAEYEVNPDKLQSPRSFTISFDTQGGNFIPPVTAQSEFISFQIVEPFQGTFLDNIYRFQAEDGWLDTLRATYGTKTLILPVPEKKGEQFAGWYEDVEGQRFVGSGGAAYTPDEDVTLYAKWSDLTLWSTDNYAVNQGRGAVDLRWTKGDSENKLYKLYMAREDGAFEQIYRAEDTAQTAIVERQYSYSGARETYAVPYSGLYTLTAKGAAGSDSGGHQGGKGGFVTGRFYLERGEILTITCGGSNGYNGGGKSTDSRHGGGATTIESSRQGLLLCAGGGGAAGVTGNGGGGGENTSLRRDNKSEGQNGSAGGGGGFVGGTAGINIAHHHSPDNPVCNYHKHTEACYGKAFCGGTKQLIITKTYGFWDDNGDGYCDQCMPNPIRRAEHNYNHYHWSYSCMTCGKQHSPTYSGYDSQPCDNMVGKELVCARGTYSCAYEEGHILSAKPAYGGSSYVNESLAIHYSMTPGLQSGNGSASIYGEELGLLSDLALEGVFAPDREAPHTIDEASVVIEAVANNMVEVHFRAPADRGTRYRFRAESYGVSDGNLLCTSNVTTNTLTSGIKGYLYLIDKHGTSEVTLQNASNRKQIQRATELICHITDEEQYLHIAAVDRADNVGATTHIRIAGDDMEWPIRTDRIQVSSVVAGADRGTVQCADTNCFYVRADGEGMFQLSYTATMDGEARADYQIDYAQLAVAIDSAGKSQEIITKLPLSSPHTADTTLDGASFRRQLRGDSLLVAAQYAGAERKNSSTTNEFYQSFRVPAGMEGRTLVVTPVAGATTKRGIKYSKWTEDVTHAVALICDGTAPTISGLELLQDMETQQRLGKGEIVLKAEDTLSGLQSFAVLVYNLDSLQEKTYVADKNGVVCIPMTDPILQSGLREIELTAKDRVGNGVRERLSIDEIQVQAKIERILEPHEPLFIAGESGILKIELQGSVDWLEVDFAPEFRALEPKLHWDFFYTDGAPSQEHIVFMIPLRANLEGQFRVTVRAYKGHRYVACYPTFTMKPGGGSVLTDFRTRLR